LSLQMIGVVLFLVMARYARRISIDPFRRGALVRFALFATLSAWNFFTVRKLLAGSNVSTVLLLQSWSLVLVAILEPCCLRRRRKGFPRRFEILGLLLILAGARGYHSYTSPYKSTSEQSTDTMSSPSTLWSFLSVVTMTMEALYGRKVSTLLQTRSGPVFYNCLTGWVPLWMIAAWNHEYHRIPMESSQLPTTIHMASVALCFVGCGTTMAWMYTSWWCRERLSATSFHVTDFSVRMILILLSAWIHKAPPTSIGCLATCLVGVLVYLQSTSRALSMAIPTKLPTVLAVMDSGDDVWESSINSLDDYHHPSPSFSTTEDEEGSVSSESAVRRR
jgi:hypothetical protein